MKAARPAATVCALAALAAAGCTSAAADHDAARTLAPSGSARPSPSVAAHPSPSPHTRVPPAGAPLHTVVVMLENHSYSQVVNKRSAPFLNDLAHSGALFTHSQAITHPSQPNYLALFSGSTQGVPGDSCPQRFTGPNLASELIAAGYTFAGYSEGLPSEGSNACAAGNYARRHVPWTNFTTVPPSVNLPFSAFPAKFSALPTVSFVIPDLCHDMHDCSVRTGDRWLEKHLGPYAAWAMTHRSLLIVDFDENDGSPGNMIATIFFGGTVEPGPYGEPITHYSVLRTIENLYGLRPLGHAASARPITNVWKSGT